MKKKEITSVLYELHKITGFRMSLHDVNFEEIAAYPPYKLPICDRIHKIPGEIEKCRLCDKEAFRRVQESRDTVIYKCRFGLTEAVSPLYNFGILTGYLMMGQISDDKTSPEEIVNALKGIKIPEEEISSLVGEVRIIPEELIGSYVKIMMICAQYLTLSNAMSGDKPTIAEVANKYICENLDKKITIKSICDTVGCSKTTLASSFKKEYGVTVNTAITRARLDLAHK